MKIDGLVKTVLNSPLSSFPWKRESSLFRLFLESWIPAFARMTIYCGRIKEAKRKIGNLIVIACER
jgi:hypothetical protein